MTTQEWRRIDQMKDPLYIAGAFTPRTQDGILIEDPPLARAAIERNRLDAAVIATAVRRCGYAAIIPHMESVSCEDGLSEPEWLQHGFALLRVCSGIVLVPGWARSSGTSRERKLAESLGKAIFEARCLHTDPRVSIPRLWTISAP